MEVLFVSNFVFIIVDRQVDYSVNTEENHILVVITNNSK